MIVVPHITDAIQEWVERVANQSVSEDGNTPEVQFNNNVHHFTLITSSFVSISKILTTLHKPGGRY